MKNNFIEANLGRATYLQFRGYKLDELVPIGHRMVAFSFIDHDGKAHEIAAEFSAGGSSSPKALLDCFADLKTQMYQFKSKNEGKEANDVIRNPRQTRHQ